MGIDTTSVAGQGASEACILNAGMLNLDIYQTPRGSLPGELQTYWDRNSEHWNKEWEINNADGFCCAFYTPKEAQAAGSNSSSVENLCPPVLVFRGSDSEPEDFAQLAFGLRFHLDAFIDKPWPASNIDPDPFDVDTSFSSSEDHRGKTMAEMDAGSLQREDLFTGAAGSERINIAVPWWGDATVTIDWRLDAALFYGQSGDWAVDFAQGLGEVPPQYTAAIAAAERAATQAEADWAGRLMMTGHSLGGGLASCAAIAARIAHPDLVMSVRTFNAAGLHANTALRAGGTLSTASEVPVVAEHVRHEILSSMQSITPMVPLLSHLMLWGGKTLPPAVAAPSPIAGISPGAMSISGLTYAPKGDPLPILYPLEDQSLVTPAFTQMAQISGIANGSNTVEDFVSGLLRHIMTSLSGGGDLTAGQAGELSEALEGGGLLPADFMESLKNAITTGSPPPQLDLGDSDYLNNIAEPFVNGLLVDLANFARILMASGEYHTFPPCAFTLLLPGLEAS